MKIAVCGKGGCGKSTVSALLAKCMAKKGNKVLVVDIDESNYGLHSHLGLDMPETLIDHFGGKKEYGKKMQAAREEQRNSIFDRKWKIGDIPSDLIASKGGIKLISVGKIQDFGEGCACPLGSLSRQFFENLELNDNEVVIADTEAGIEHLGRSIERGFDFILIIVDPSYESLRLSKKIEDITKDNVGKAYIVLNRVEDGVKDIMMGSLDKDKVAAIIPVNKDLFKASLAGKEFDSDIREIDGLAEFLINNN
ncbi:ATP-binding protein [Methanocella sp. CWC-04]|uniref:ATP-binding protein n=1 Tax=Methanooceanicella nereidis TaxID=2052831 RepID=A0AAP2RFT3_9EURY|nr:AAA family ATPase [Methanocella sp. CWC-04]MCD1295427.1 ATP-binding protein [Methanocella sp. CWC-04]